jgi:hypothetical protein
MRCRPTGRRAAAWPTRKNTQVDRCDLLPCSTRDQTSEGGACQPPELSFSFIFHVGNKIDKGLAGYGLKGSEPDGHCRCRVLQFPGINGDCISKQRLQRSTEWSIPANNVLLIRGGFCRRIESARVSSGHVGHLLI